MAIMRDTTARDLLIGTKMSSDDLSPPMVVPSSSCSGMLS